MSSSPSLNSAFVRTVDTSWTVVKLVLGLLIGLVVVGPWFGAQLVNQSRGVPAWHPMQDLCALVDSQGSTPPRLPSSNQVVDNNKTTIVGAEDNNLENGGKCSSLETPPEDSNNADDDPESVQEKDDNVAGSNDLSSHELPVECTC